MKNAHMPYYRARLNNMKAACIFFLMVLSVSAFAADPVKIQFPGFSIVTLSNSAGGDEFWIPYTKPLDISRYALTNVTLTHPIYVTILHYPAPEQARQAFELSFGGRPQAPDKFEAPHWDAAHRWPSASNMYLLKRDYLVGVYRLPSDFPGAKLDGLLAALADSLTKAQSSNTGRSPP